MQISRRYLLMGMASVSVLATAVPTRIHAAVKIDVDPEIKGRLMRMVKVAFPHKTFPDSCYDRTCEAIIKASKKDPASMVMFAEGMADLKEAGFDIMDDGAALEHLKSIEGTPFFQLMRGTTVTSLYNDHEVWGILGYEGASFDQGGYINRGFNDLDWLPDPRITEL